VDFHNDDWAIGQLLRKGALDRGGINQKSSFRNRQSSFLRNRPFVYASISNRMAQSVNQRFANKSSVVNPQSSLGR